MKKILSILALSIMACHAHASFISEHDLIKLAQDTGNVRLQESIRQDVMKSEKSAAAWINTWANYEKQGEYQNWPEVGLNLLRWSQPAKTYEWRAAVRIEGSNVPAYQQDSLIDLERTQAYHLTHQTTTGMVHAYTIADTANPNYQLIATSERRLTMGIAPIGPDNAPIKVCKLGRSSMAPYIEMSETQRIEFARFSGLDFSSCIDGAQESAYWKARYHDYVRADFTRTDNHNPGASW